MGFFDFANDGDPTWTQLWNLFLAGLVFHILRSVGRNLALLFVSSVNSVWTHVATRAAAKREAALARDEKNETVVFHALHQFRRSTRATPLDFGENVLGKGYTYVFNTYKSALRFYSSHRVLSGVVSAFLNTIVIILYWLSTSRKEITRSVGIIQFLLGLWFLAEIFLHFSFDQGEQSLFEYIFDPGVFFDSWAIPSILASGLGGVSYINLNYFRLWTLYRAVAQIFYPSGNNPLNLSPNEVGAFTPYLVLLVINLLAIIFSCALTIYSFERLGEIVASTPLVVDENGFIWNIVTANYFILVTGTTVGYGDFLPGNGLSRLAVTIIIATVVFYVGGKLGTVIGLMALSRLGDGEYQGNPEVNPHIVVTGQIEYSGLDSLINAYFSDPANDRSRIVILMPRLRFTISEYYSLMSGEGRARRIHFIRGSPFDGHDRHRANCRNARAVLVMSARETDDAIGDDSLNVLSVSAIRDKLPTVPILSMHILRESAHNVEQAIFATGDQVALKRLADPSLLDFLDKRRRSGDRVSYLERIRNKFNVDSVLDIFHRKKLEHLVLDQMGVPVRVNAPNFDKAKGESLCLREFLVALLSINVHCPGASTLIANAVFELDLKHYEDDHPWKWEYKYGASNDFYIWNLPAEAEGIAFAELALLLFQTTGALLITLVDGGIQEESDIASWSSFGTKSSKAIVLAPLELTANSAVLISNLTEVLRAKRQEVDLSSRIQPEDGPAVLQLRAHGREFSVDDWLLNLGQNFSGLSTYSAPADLKTLENHVVICGFDASVFAEVELLARQLQKTPFGLENENERPPFVFLGPEIAESAVTKLKKRVPTFFTVVGNPEIYQDLLSINVKAARAVLVMPEARSSLEIPDEDDAFATQDFESADARTMYSALNIDLALGENSTTQVVLYLKDIRSVSFCPRPRSKMLGIRLGESGQSNDELRPVSTVVPVPREGSSQSSLANSANEFEGTRPNTTRFEEGAFGGTDLTQFRSVDDTASFSRMRYAAGQIVVPSVAPTLLVREHQIPGILGLVRTILGCGGVDGPMIRQFSVPRSFNGASYSTLFTKVISLKGLPMGLYRSGRAKIVYDPFEETAEQTTGLSPRFGLRNRDDGEEKFGERPSSADESAKKARNVLPWVFTNPPPNTVMSFTDAVFVLARDFEPLTKYFLSAEKRTSFEE